MTTINAERNFKAGNGSASREDADSAGKNSAESLTRGNMSGGLGGIKVDTEVEIVESHSPLDFGFEDDRKERKDMI